MRGDTEMFAFDEWLAAHKTDAWSDLDLWRAACAWQRQEAKALIADYEAARNILRTAEPGSDDERMACAFAAEKYRQLLSIA